MATAKNKTVEPGHRVVADLPAGQAEQMDQNPIYRDNMAPLGVGDGDPGIEDEMGADGEQDETDETEMRRVVLKKGGTYRFRDVSFQKGKSALVAPDVARRLLKTGMFAEG